MNLKARLGLNVCGGFVLNGTPLDDKVSRFLLPARNKSRVDLDSVTNFNVTAFDGFLLMETRCAIESIYATLQKMNRLNCFLRV